METSGIAAFRDEVAVSGGLAEAFLVRLIRSDHRRDHRSTWQRRVCFIFATVLPVMRADCCFALSPAIQSTL